MPPDPPPYWQEDVLQVHAAIGYFVTTFSDLLLTMRRQMTRIISSPTNAEVGARDPLIDILFDRMTADPLVAAYFAMTTEVGALNDPDREVRNALRHLVQFYVAVRNGLVHADWDIGWEDVETGTPVPATASKIKTSSSGVRLEQIDADPQAIRGAAARVARVNQLTGIYGDICRRRQRGDTQIRPSDVLETYRTPEPVGRAVRERR